MEKHGETLFLVDPTEGTCLTRFRQDRLVDVWIILVALEVHMKQRVSWSPWSDKDPRRYVVLIPDRINLIAINELCQCIPVIDDICNNSEIAVTI